MAIVSGGGSSSGGGLLLSATFSLTAAQIKASTLTPTTVIGAPGANKLLVPISYVVSLVFVSVAYTDPGVDLIVGVQNFGPIFTGLSGPVSTVEWNQGVPEVWPRSDVVNKALKLRADLRGSIATSTLAAPGNGYAVNDTGTVDDGSTLATYRIDTVNIIGGDVATYTITSVGDGYVNDVDESTTVGGAQPGVGAGFTIHVGDVNASGQVGDGTLSGAIYYVVASV